jgi:hypothetical protein
MKMRRTRANFVQFDFLLRSVLAEGVPGDLAEFGVWHGTTFMPMAELALLNGRVIHAVDSFEGLAEHGERDDGTYRKGGLSVGGSTVFRDLVRPYGGTVQVHEGWVPDVFAGFDDRVRFAFAHVDLDQYEPTMRALRFVWPRTSPGGVMLCHDWFPGSAVNASAALVDWMNETGTGLAGELESGHGWFRKYV